MRRWNGWGDDSVRVQLPASALAYLRERAGSGTRLEDAQLASIAARIPQSALPADPRIDTNPETRVRHARGQSLPDWLALRYGRIDRVPDGVAFPESGQDVRDLIAFAAGCGARVIPYGGGTSVAGHVNVEPGDAPVVTVSLERMRKLLHLDETSRLAQFEAGVRGPDLEQQLRERGYTLGHYPQSFEYSTLGGWIATRSSGQQSLRYGRIEQLLAAAQIETPAGSLEIPSFPASAAGIDLREMILGSEGRIGIITQATVRISPLPERESFHGWFFPQWEAAQTAARELAQRRIALSMVRVANEEETITNLRMAGNRPGIGVLERYLTLRGAAAGKCMLIAGITGEKAQSKATLASAKEICGRNGGIYAGTRIGKGWEKNRFHGVYFRNALWECGYAVDTVETAVDWPRVTPMMRAMQNAGQRALDRRVHAYAHLSHVYPEGSSVYATFIFPLAPSYEENLTRWQSLKGSVSEAIVANGGTISHQHGVGIDHKPYLAAEKGELGIAAMRALFKRFDPDGIMNPGKLC